MTNPTDTPALASAIATVRAAGFEVKAVIGHSFHKFYSTAAVPTVCNACGFFPAHPIHSTGAAMVAAGEVKP